MSDSVTVCLKKCFTWKLENFNPTQLKESVSFDEVSPRFPEYGRYGFFQGPIVRSFDRHHNIERVATFRIKLWENVDDLDGEFFVDVTPPVSSQTCYFLLNDGTTFHQNPYMRLQGEYSNICFCVDVNIPEPYTPAILLADKLKNIYKKDPANKFTIKCQKASIDTLKPILAACSPVFEAMLASGMKEAQKNSMKIADFDSVVVEKMVEFCETDKVANFEGLEEDLFKIAHMYRIEELMDCAVIEMMKTTTKENRSDRYHLLANLSSKEEFKKWWSKLEGDVRD